MEKLFNITFFIGFIALLFSRIFFVAFHFSKHFLNPLVFSLFPYFPGLSLAGGFLSGFATFVFLARRRKMPIAKVTDMYLLSFLAALPIGFFGLAMLEGREKLQTVHLLFAGFYFLILLLILKFLYPKITAGKIRDGFISLVIIFLFSLFGIGEAILYKKPGLPAVLSGDLILFFVFLLFSIIFLVRLSLRK